MKTFHVVFFAVVSICLHTQLMAQVIVPAQVAQQQAPVVADPVDSMLLNVRSAANLAFGGDPNNKFNSYKKILVMLSPKTTVDTMQRTIDGFIQDIIEYAISQSALTVAELIQTKQAVDALIAALATTNSQLATSVGQDDKRFMISGKINTLKEKAAQLADKINVQNQFQAALNASRSIFAIKISERIASYTNLLSQLTSSIVDSFKELVFSELVQLAKQAKSAGGFVWQDCKNLLNTAQSNTVFSLSQKQQLAQLMQDALVASTALPVQVIAPGVSQPVQSYQAQPVPQVSQIPAQLQSVVRVPAVSTPVKPAQSPAPRRQAAPVPARAVPSSVGYLAAKPSTGKVAKVAVAKGVSVQKGVFAKSPALGGPVAGVPAVVGPTVALLTAQVGQVGVGKPVEVLNPLFQNKLKDVIAKKTTLEKIAGLRDLLTMVTPSTVQQEKDALLGMISDLFLSHAVMKKSELNALQVLVASLLQAPGLLAVEQQGMIAIWQSALTRAILLGDDASDLLTSIKKHIENDKADYRSALHAALYALDILLKTKIPATELGMQPPTTLVALLRKQVPVFYNRRDRKATDDLGTLSDVLKAALMVKGIGDVVNKKWVDSLSLNVDLESVKHETNILVKVGALQRVVDALQPTSDRYEKGIVIDQVTMLMNSRKDLASKENAAIYALLELIGSDQFKKKRVFDRFDVEKFDAFRKILVVTIALENIHLETGFDQKIEKLEKALPFLEKALAVAVQGGAAVPQTKADYEQQRFISAINNLFEERGNLKKAELSKLSNFFKLIQKKQHVLLPAQAAILVLWIKDLDDAIKQIIDGKTYIISAIDRAVQSKNTKLLMQAISLYTQKTPSAVQTSLANSLQTMFNQRLQLQRGGMILLLEFAYQRKSGDFFVFSQPQRDVIKQWLDIVKKG